MLWRMENWEMKQWEIQIKRKEWNGNLQELEESIFGGGKGLELGSQLYELHVRSLLSHNSYVDNTNYFMELFLPRGGRGWNFTWRNERRVLFCFLFFLFLSDAVLRCYVMLCRVSARLAGISLFEHRTEINSTCIMDVTWTMPYLIFGLTNFLVLDSIRLFDFGLYLSFALIFVLLMFLILF